MAYQITVEASETTAVLSTEEGSVQLHAEDKSASTLTFSISNGKTAPVSIKLNRREIADFVKCFAETTSRLNLGGFGKR